MTGNCKECERCDNKMLCVTSGYPMFVNYADNCCFNFENKDFSRPKEIYRHLKDRYDDKRDRNREYEMNNRRIMPRIRPTQQEIRRQNEAMRMQKMQP